MEENVKEVTVNYVINGIELTLGVRPEDERLYRTAGRLINKRVTELQQEHTYHLSAVQIALLAAIENAVSALSTQEEYKKFQDEVNGYLDSFNVA